MSIEIVNLQRCMKVPAALLRAAVRRVMTEELAREVNVSVAVVDDDRIAELNWVFLGRPEPTDVLAFPLDEGRSAADPEQVFGEIVISAERARREARMRHAEPETELLLYAVHGMLHLAGHDDRTPRERKRMRHRETDILGSLVVARHRTPARNRVPRLARKPCSSVTAIARLDKPAVAPKKAHAVQDDPWVHRRHRQSRSG